MAPSTTRTVLNETNLQIKQITADQPTHPAIVGNKVFDVLPTTDELVSFPSRKKYLLLQLLWRGIQLEEAAAKCGLTLEEATAYKDSPKAADYLRRKELAAIIAEETKSEDNWWVEVHQVRAGEKVLNKGQMVALQASGDRVAPKKTELNPEKNKIVINLNFSAEAVKEAFRRQESIETEIVQEQNGH